MDICESVWSQWDTQGLVKLFLSNGPVVCVVLIASIVFEGEREISTIKDKEQTPEE